MDTDDTGAGEVKPDSAVDPHGRGTGEHAAGWDRAMEVAAQACEKWGRLANSQGHDDAWQRDLAEYLRFAYVGRMDKK